MAETVIKDEVSGQTMVEVEPGSADDLLLTDEARAAKAASTGAAAAADTSATEGDDDQGDTTQPPATAPGVKGGGTGEVEWTEEDLAALERLDSFMEEQVEARATERLRAFQSKVDGRIAGLQKEHTAEVMALREQVREAQLVGLTDAEKTRLQEHWDYEDKKAEVDKAAKEVEEYHHDVMVVAYTLEYGRFGVKEEDLADMTIEEMETACLQKKASYFEDLAQHGGVKPAAAPTAAQKPAAPAPQKPAPAGASAPSDVGASAPAPAPKEFDKGMGRDAMFKNMQNLPVEEVRIPKRA
jgi:hypothetical protein